MNEVLFPLHLISFSLVPPSSQSFFFLSTFIYDYDDVEIRNVSFQLFLFFKINVHSFLVIFVLDTLGVFSLIIQHVFDFHLVLLPSFLISFNGQLFFYVFFIFYDDDSFRLMT